MILRKCACTVVIRRVLGRILVVMSNMFVRPSLQVLLKQLNVLRNIKQGPFETFVSCVPRCRLSVLNCLLKVPRPSRQCGVPVGLVVSKLVVTPAVTICVPIGDSYKRVLSALG